MKEYAHLTKNYRYAGLEAKKQGHYWGFLSSWRRFG